MSKKCPKDPVCIEQGAYKMIGNMCPNCNELRKLNVHTGERICRLCGFGEDSVAELEREEGRR